MLISHAPPTTASLFWFYYSVFYSVDSQTLPNHLLVSLRSVLHLATLQSENLIRSRIFMNESSSNGWLVGSNDSTHNNDLVMTTNIASRYKRQQNKCYPQRCLLAHFEATLDFSRSEFTCP